MAKKTGQYAADLVLQRGRVHTGNPGQLQASAVAIRGGRIVAVGTETGIEGFVGKATRVLDLQGRFVCAGFNDAHAHLLSGGSSLSRVDLSGAGSFEDLRARIEARAADLPEGAWVLGRGWDQTLLPGGAWPPLPLLDEAARGRPALLWRTDGHASWANAAALAAAGVSESTPDPPGGGLLRDASGRLTGILLETASELVEQAVPPPDLAVQRSSILAALEHLRRAGVTSVSDNSPADVVRVYRELRQEGRLTVRVNYWSSLDEGIEAAEVLREQFRPDNAYLRGNTIKGFVDGTLGSWTALVGGAYLDAPGSAGLRRFEPEELARLVGRAHKSGFQVALHAIGDRAVREALDAIESLGPYGRGRRHRIEHAEIVDPSDLPRFASLGVVASMQPSQWLGDARWLETRLGAARAAWAFPWRPLVDGGVPLAFGSDWPIEPPDPVRDLAAATGRLVPAGSGLRIGALSPAEALAASTVGGAYASFEEMSKGRIVAGQLADVVVLADDPFSGEAGGAAPAVDYTIFDGKVVHAREGAPHKIVDPPPNSE